MAGGTIVDTARHRDLEEVLADAFAATLVTPKTRSTRQPSFIIAPLHVKRAKLPQHDRPSTHKHSTDAHVYWVAPPGGFATFYMGAPVPAASGPSFCSSASGPPVPLTNRMPHRYQVDALWPHHRLVVEIDG